MASPSITGDLSAKNFFSDMGKTVITVLFPHDSYGGQPPSAVLPSLRRRRGRLLHMLINRKTIETFAEVSWFQIARSFKADKVDYFGT
jgi:hypothetical protein